VAYPFDISSLKHGFNICLTHDEKSTSLELMEGSLCIIRLADPAATFVTRICLAGDNPPYNNVSADGRCDETRALVLETAEVDS